MKEAGVGDLTENNVRFTATDRLKAAIIGLSLGCSFSEVSSLLDWRDFEIFAREIFERNEYQAVANVRINRPRVQIDVLAYKGSSATCVDCKHWGTPRGPSAMRAIAISQLLRTKALMRSQWSRRLTIKEAIPLVITLREENKPMAEGVPIVPVDKLQNFVANIEAFRDQAVVISRFKQP